MNWLEFIDSQREIAYLVVGALIGFLSSTAMWRRQLIEERKRKRSDLALRAIQLCTSSLTYARALAYAKLSGHAGIANLPENPIDELMAIAGLHFHEACPLVQQLHEMQQKLFGHTVVIGGDNEVMAKYVFDMAPLVNQLMQKIGRLSDH